ncbi:MAG TPA: hypothetical protein VJY62_11115 [Bacteroidia bacterium]|nr:hypothetical protein [Bacteroidia bacterium]
MIELLVAILIALGSLTNRTDFNDEYKTSHQNEISRAQSIIDSGQYRIEDGGVTVDPHIGT